MILIYYYTHTVFNIVNAWFTACQWITLKPDLFDDYKVPSGDEEFKEMVEDGNYEVEKDVDDDKEENYNFCASKWLTIQGNLHI